MCVPFKPCAASLVHADTAEKECTEWCMSVGTCTHCPLWVGTHFLLVEVHASKGYSVQWLQGFILLGGLKE